MSKLGGGGGLSTYDFCHIDNTVYFMLQFCIKVMRLVSDVVCSVPIREFSSWNLYYSKNSFDSHIYRLLMIQSQFVNVRRAISHASLPRWSSRSFTNLPFPRLDFRRKDDRIISFPVITFLELLCRLLLRNFVYHQLFDRASNCLEKKRDGVTL